MIFGPEVNCYKCPIKHQYPQCDVACADYLEHMIENESDVAAVLIEPVVGTNGVLVPPPEYLPRLRQICDRHKVLLDCRRGDERLGTNRRVVRGRQSGCEAGHFGNGEGNHFRLCALGLCATTKRIADHFEDHMFAHGHTYEAHPMTLAPAIATILEMQRLNLIQRARDMGRYLGERLRWLKERHPSIGDVRGLGLFWAIELVKNQATKQPFNTKEDKISGKPLLVDKIAAEMMKNGVTVNSWISHFVIAPPLIIEKSEIDLGIAAFDSALKMADDLVEQ